MLGKVTVKIKLTKSTVIVLHFRLEQCIVW